MCWGHTGDNGKENGNYGDCIGVLGIYRGCSVYISNTWTSTGLWGLGCLHGDIWFSSFQKAMVQLRNPSDLDSLGAYHQGIPYVGNACMGLTSVVECENKRIWNGIYVTCLCDVFTHQTYLVKKEMVEQSHTFGTGMGVRISGIQICRSLVVRARRKPYSIRYPIFVEPVSANPKP